MRNAVSNVVGYIELTTGDASQAKDFYSKLFGWNFQDAPIPGGGTYSMMNAEDGAGAGIMQSPPGAPTAWMPYVVVDDVARATEQARSLGATVIRDIMPIPGIGAFSIIADPTGAAIGMWANEPKP